LRFHEWKRKWNIQVNPPTQEEYNRALARRMFGRYAEQFLKYAPWSFLLVKKIWKKGEEPWKS